MRLRGGKFLSAQLERPTGWFGRLYMAAMLEQGNAALYDFSLGLMDVQASDRVLEIGFGGGKSLGELARLAPAGFVAGVDVSPEMVAVARKRFAALLASGRLDIRAGDLAALEYPDAEFDKILSANTLYFWKDAPADAREILRVLKPGGRLYLAFRPREVMEKIPFLDRGVFRLYSEADVRELFLGAGAADVRFEGREEEAGFPSFCAVITRA